MEQNDFIYIMYSMHWSLCVQYFDLVQVFLDILEYLDFRILNNCEVFDTSFALIFSEFYSDPRLFLACTHNLIISKLNMKQNSHFMTTVIER